jgi:hypothetical protein
MNNYGCCLFLSVELNIFCILRDTILEIIKEVPQMPNAKDYVNQSMSSVQNTVNTLQQALSNAEKPENKNKIQQAIDSLNSVQDQLSGYQD